MNTLENSFIAFQMISVCSPCPLKSFRKISLIPDASSQTPSNIPAKLESSFLFLFGIPFWISVGNLIFYFRFGILFFIISVWNPVFKFLLGIPLQITCVDLIPPSAPRLSFGSPRLSYHVKIPKSSNIPILLLPEPLRIKSHCPYARFGPIFWFICGF